MRYSCGLYKLMLRSFVCIALLMFGIQSAWGQNNSCLEVMPDGLDFYGDLCNGWLLQESIEYKSIYIMAVCGDTGLYWEVDPDAAWLGVIPPSGYDSDSVLVWIVKEHLGDLPDSLPPGDTLLLESIVTVTAGDPNIPPEQVVVRLHLSCTPNQPLLMVAPPQLAFAGPPGATMEDSLFVFEAHGDTIYFGWSNSSQWLTLPVYFAPVATPFSLPVYVHTEGLTPGIYEDMIVLHAFLNDSTGPFQTLDVPVVLHVTGGGSEFVVHTIPSEFNFSLSGGTGTSDSLHVFEVNGHNVPFHFSNTHSWLVVDPFPMPPYSTPMTLTVAVGANNLPPGNYVDTIVIMPVDPNVDFDTVRVPVFVSIHDGPNLIVYPNHFEFAAQPGDVIPHQGIAVWEAHGLSIPFAAEVMHGSPWLDIEDTQPDNMYWTPDSVYFGIYANDLGPGQYVDTIVLYAPHDSIPFPPVAIPVWLVVDSLGFQLVVDPQQFDYAVPSGHSFEDYLHIEELHGATLALSFTHEAPWLTLPVWFTVPTTPMTLPFGVSTEGMAPGVYHDVLTITAYSENVEPPVDVAHVPFTLIVTEGQPFTVLAAPDHFEFTLNQGNHVIGEEFLVYDLDSANLSFAATVFNNSPWLTLDSGTAFGVTPSHVGFHISIAGLAPGTYGDSVLIYYPLDDMYGFDDVIVPVVLHILPDSGSAVVATDPQQFSFVLPQGGAITTGLYIYEVHGEAVPFHIWSHAPWLHLDFNDQPPFLTPYMSPVTVQTDSLPPGYYHDTITIWPDTDGVSFPPVGVPVLLRVTGPGTDPVDSLIVPSITVTPCDWACAVQPVQTKLTQPIKGATIPISIPEGVSICSLSTEGLMTSEWDWNFSEVNDSLGYVFVALANSFDATIPPGVSTVFNIHFNVVPGCSDAAYIRWDTTLMLDVAKRLAFADTTYTTVHPGFDYWRDRVEIVGYVPGNFDADPVISISDLVGVVDYMFSYGPPPCVIDALDVNGDCIGPDISDLVFLIDWMFNPLDPPAFPDLNCGCVTSDGAAVAKPNPEIVLRAVYENGATDIILNSPVDLRGLQLHLRADGTVAPQKLVDDGLDLVHGVRGENVRVGILDLDGDNVIESGETAVVRLIGRVRVVEAVVADKQYGSMQASVESVGGLLPDGYSLGQNYPNPFNPVTAITFSLPKAANISLDVYNVVGQKVAILADGRHEVGTYTVAWDARDLSSGVYFYRLSTPEFETTRKMVLLK